MKNELRFSNFQKVVLIILAVSVVFFQFVDLSDAGYFKDVQMIKNATTRFVVGFILLYAIISIGRNDLMRFGNIKKSLLIILLALIVSLNNFPVIAYMDGRANLSEPFYRVILFLIECLSVGFFEEILFRGILLIVMIEKFSDLKGGTRISVIISSLIFGLVHLVNLFDGASLGSTILQVGYSFLMGMLWAMIYLKTGNIWVVMILHATYNFFGQVMFYLGAVENRFDPYTILITVILAMIVASYALHLYTKGELITKHQKIGESHEI